MGVSSATLQRYIAEETAPPFDAIARLAIESGARMEWLATGEGPMTAAEAASQLAGGAVHEEPGQASQPARLDEGTLADALAVIDQALVLTRRTATPKARAQLVAMAYRVLVEEGQVSAALSRIIEAVDAATKGE